MRDSYNVTNWLVTNRNGRVGCQFAAVVLLALTVVTALPIEGQALNGAYTIGIFRPSFDSQGNPGQAIWAVDSAGIHTWQPSDPVYYFGLGGDIPVMGDWTFTNQRRLGVFRNGYWYVDTDDSRSWTATDSTFAFGVPGDLALTLGWSDGYLHLAVFRPSEGALYIDTSHCNCYSGATLRFPIYNTQTGDLPIMINADGQGARLAFFRPSTGNWYAGPLVASGTLTFDLNYAPVYQYGGAGDLPVAGDWTGTGGTTWNIGVYRGQGLWYVDSNGDRAWEPSDAVFNAFGLAGDTPVMGSWATASGGVTATPTFGPASGNYATSQSVAIGTITPGATICYTTDGTTPSETSGTVYNGPLSVTASRVLKAIAYAPGYADSAVATATYVISAPDGFRTGIKSTGVYWGGAGEQIDLLSGNLNYSLPLVQIQGRGASGAVLGLSYNSQIWRQLSGTNYLQGLDIGYGLGWTMQLGALIPESNYYIFADATGAQYKLDQYNGTVWTSRDGTYVAYSPSLQQLFFPDGRFWTMNVVSASGEPDAGWRYPSKIEDSNGNYVTLQYPQGSGGGTINTSGRITQITDPLATGSNPSYSFTYTKLHWCPVKCFAKTDKCPSYNYLAGFWTGNDLNCE